MSNFGTAYFRNVLEMKQRNDEGSSRALANSTGLLSKRRGLYAVLGL